jgi:limonene-1,2-epoxide hydrolase
MKIEEYASFFENIKEDTKKQEYEKYFSEEVNFKDPFHQIKGIENIYNIFQNMFQNLDNTKFDVTEIVSNKKIAYLKWDFTFSFKNKKEINRFTGVSRVVFDENNKVLIHEDYWDAAHNIYEKFPILSSLLKFAKSKIQN